MPMAVARAIPMNKKPVAQAVAMPDDGVLRARDGSIIEMGKAGIPNRGCTTTQNQYEASQREARNERLRILNEHGIWGMM